MEGVSLTIGVIVAMEAELSHSLDLFASRIHKADKYAKTQEIYFGDELVLCISGVGKVNAASAAAMLLSLHYVDVLISIGVSGSLADDFNVGDIALVTTALEHDLDLRPIVESPGVAMGQSSPLHRSHAKVTETLHLAVEPLLESWSCSVYDRFGTRATLHTATVATGDTLVTSVEQKSAIVSQFPAAQLVDMETGAIAKVAINHGVPWGALRVVSDSADSKEVAREVFAFCSWEGSKLIASTIAHLIEIGLGKNGVIDDL